MSGVFWALQSLDLRRLSPLTEFLEVEVRSLPERTSSGMLTIEDDEAFRAPILCTTPETVVASAIEEGSDPDQALEAWLQEAEQLLGLLRGRDEAPCLLFVEDSVRSSSEFLVATQRLLDVERDDHLPESKAFRLPSMLPLTMASRLLETRPEIAAAESELRQWSPIPEDKYDRGEHAGIKGAVSELCEQYVDLARKATLIEQFREENRILLSQLQQAEAALDATLARADPESRRLRRSLFARIVRISKACINPRNPLVWKLSAPLRLASRPLRGKLKAVLNS